MQQRCTQLTPFWCCMPSTLEVALLLDGLLLLCAVD